MQPKQTHFEKALWDTLFDATAFGRLADYFIEEATANTEDFDGFRRYFNGSAKALMDVNAEQINRVAQSPIEQVFLRSLLLSFIKNDGLGLLVHPTFKDTNSEIAEFRATLENFLEFKKWFEEHKPAKDAAAFLDLEMSHGKMGLDERCYYDELLFKYYYVPLDGSYHMSLQPRFPDIIVGGKPIRPDIYFWVPKRPEINIIVECDGFAFHSDKISFTRDRQRDRVLKARGFDVFRFSGSEIYRDPVNSAFELASYLWERMR